MHLLQVCSFFHYHAKGSSHGPWDLWIADKCADCKLQDEVRAQAGDSC